MQVFNPFPTAAGGASGVSRVGAGIAVQNGDQQVGRSLVGISPVMIRHPEGITGDPQISLLPQSMMIGSAEIDMAVTTEHPIHVQGVDSYIIRRVVIGMATAVPDAAARLAITTAQGQTGNVILPAQGLGDLDPASRYRVLDLPVTNALYHRAPVLFVRPTVVNPAPLKLRVFVFGDALTGAEF